MRFSIVSDILHRQCLDMNGPVSDYHRSIHKIEVVVIGGQVSLGNRNVIYAYWCFGSE